jgi:hypothetical protein
MDFPRTRPAILHNRHKRRRWQGLRRRARANSLGEARGGSKRIEEESSVAVDDEKEKSNESRAKPPSRRAEQ